MKKVHGWNPSNTFAGYLHVKIRAAASVVRVIFSSSGTETKSHPIYAADSTFLATSSLLSVLPSTCSITTVNLSIFNENAYGNAPGGDSVSDRQSTHLHLLFLLFFLH